MMWQRLRQRLSSIPQVETARASQVTAALSALALLGLTAWAGAGLTWRLLGPEPLSASPAVTAGAMPGGAPEVSRAPGLERVIAAQLFGAPRAERPVSVPLADTPETQLKLTLKGVMAASDPARGQAVIADASRREEAVYRVGDAVPGGATLAQIFADRVVLSRQGRFELLRLPREEADVPQP